MAPQRVYEPRNLEGVELSKAGPLLQRIAPERLERQAESNVPQALDALRHRQSERAGVHDELRPRLEHRAPEKAREGVRKREKAREGERRCEETT